MARPPRRPPAPRLNALIWERMDAERPGRRPALSLGRIVERAAAIADAEGLDALSMRRVAADLGAGAMSLYRYVSSKDDLLDLLLDAAFGEIEPPRARGRDWREALAGHARATRAALARHPWLGALLSARPPLGPRYLAYFERLLDAASGASRDPQTVAAVVGTLSVYVMGFVGYERAEREAERRAGLSPSQKRATVAPYLDRLLASGRFPRLSRHLEVAREVPTDEDFEFGLAVVLDGLERHLTPRPPRRTRAGR